MADEVRKRIPVNHGSEKPGAAGLIQTFCLWFHVRDHSRRGRSGKLSAVLYGRCGGSGYS